MVIDLTKSMDSKNEYKYKVMALTKPYKLIDVKG